MACSLRVMPAINNCFAGMARSFQYLVAILRYPYKVVLNLKHRMTAVSVFHAAPHFVWHIVAAKAGVLAQLGAED